MKALSERATLIFPYAIAAILPLAGLVLAGLWAFEKRTYDAGVVLGCALLGGLIEYTLLVN